MKKLFLSLVYTLAIVVVGIIIYMIVSPRIDHYLYSYEFDVYNHEIDSFFNKIASKQFRVKHVYKSGERGSIYFVDYDSLSKIAILETSNFHDIFIEAIESDIVNQIELTQAKTYSTILNETFPIIQQALNPRESDYLKISIEKPAQIENRIKNKSYYYLKGNFNYVAFRNTQNCSIITFQKDFINEILVTKYNGKLYFIFQTIAGKSLLDIINPSLLQEKEVASARNK